MSYNLTTYLRSKKRYEEKKKSGICVTCNNKAEKNKTNCKTCSKKKKTNYKKRKKELLDSMIGKCD